MDETIEALELLIRWYTERRDWFMVERLNNDLGNLLRDRESETRSQIS